MKFHGNLVSVVFSRKQSSYWENLHNIQLSHQVELNLRLSSNCKVDLVGKRSLYSFWDIRRQPISYNTDPRSQKPKY